ncbi:MAG: thioredoxin-disulfide reductase [Syntrophomonadaceae bacterium]|nr:thioredoxin-disulfide reductase [Syntrophomonadaceae bacterium]
MEKYDVIIIGGGPAGLTSGLYTARARIKTLLLEKGTPGGQASMTELIENYPGFPQGISGLDLMLNFQEQATRFGLEMRYQEVIEIGLDQVLKQVKTEENCYQARAVIISSGAAPRKLGITGEEQFTGRGVSYCATCDGAFFQDQTVAVVGGGDAAVEEAVYLTRFAQTVYLIHRRGALRAARVVQERAFNNPKIRFLWHTAVKEIQGKQKVEKLILENLQDNQISELNVNGVFIYIGVDPNTRFLQQRITLSPEGYIETNNQLETSVPGIFAAGDVRNKELRQVSTAVGDGALAALAVERYLAAETKI